MLIVETEDEFRMKLIKWETNLEAQESTWEKPTSWLSKSTSKRWKALVNTLAVFVEKVLPVTPSTVVDA